MIKLNKDSKLVMRGGVFKICHNIEIGELDKFIEQVNEMFPVPLSAKVDLHCYAKKLFDHGTFCGIRNEGRIVALACGYANQRDSGLAYLSMIATLPEYRGNGFASLLLEDFISICKGKGFKALHLYAVESNVDAMKMYHKHGFTEYRIDSESRPLDKHLILYF